MSTLVLILKILLPITYAGALTVYGRMFFLQGQPGAGATARTTLFGALGVHSALLVLLGAQYQRCPLWTQGEALLFLGWMLLVLHSLTEWSADTRRLGFFTLLPAALCGVISLFFLGNELTLAEEYRSAWFIFHIVASLASYAAFSFAAVLAALYLVQYGKLKHKHFDRTFRRLPPLDRLDKLAAVWSFLGALLMIASSVIGAWWVRRDGLRGMSLEEAGILLVLGLFLFAAAARRLFGWRGRRHALWLLCSFAALVFANLWLHGFFRL